MLNTIIDNLSRLEDLNIYIPSLIQLGVLIFWIFIIRISKASYRTSVGLSLFMLFLSLLFKLITIAFLAQTLAEYAFMFLGVGIIQIVFSKEESVEKIP